MHARKAREGAAWSLDAGDVFTQIELSHFISLASAGVCHAYCYLYGIGALDRLYGKMIVAEGGVAESEAEGKEWLAVVVDVFADA